MTLATWAVILVLFDLMTCLGGCWTGSPRVVRVPVVHNHYVPCVREAPPDDDDATPDCEWTDGACWIEALARSHTREVALRIYGLDAWIRCREIDEFPTEPDL
jgi:hypothetical protein